METIESVVQKLKPLVHSYAVDMKVLIVEDEESNIEFYKIAFGNFFQVCDIAVDGLEAYELWKEKKDYYDLIVTDMLMPRMNGLELIRKIREYSIEQSIIVITGVKELEANQRLAFYYVDAILPKPINNKKLYMLFYRVLKKIAEKKELDFYLKDLERQQCDAVEVQSHLDFMCNKLASISHYKEVRDVISLLKTVSKKQSDKAKLKNKIVEEKKSKVEISSSDENYLRKSTVDMTLSSTELLSQLDDSIVDKIENFLSILDKVATTLYDIEEQDPQRAIKSLTKIHGYFQEFIEILDLLVVFPIVERAFVNLNSFLATISEEHFEDKEKKMFLVSLLLNVEKDVSRWIDTIFIKNKAENIYYFDASFLNGMLEIEALFNNEFVENENAVEIEFFL